MLYVTGDPMRPFLGWLLGCTLMAQPAQVLRIGHLLDVKAGRWMQDQALRLEGGRIIALGPWQPADPAPDVDLRTSWVIPGLMDAHTHLFLQGNADAAAYEAQILKESVPTRTLRAAVAARAALRQGFTTLRDLGTEGAGHADTDLKRAIASGLVPGPRLQVADLAFSATGAYPVLSPAWELQLPVGVQSVDGVDAIRKGVREQVRFGADWIKVYIDRGQRLGTDGRLHSTLNFTPEELAAFISEARRQGKRTAAHAHGWEGIDAALTAGFDSLEHGSGFDEGLLKRAAAQGTVWCPTLAAMEFVAPTRGGVYTKELPERLHRAFALGVKLGVRIVNGSDAGAFPWDRPLTRELELMAAHGMTNLQALQAATIRAAEALGLASELGALEPGRRADFVVLTADPLADLQALRRVQRVYKDGLPQPE
jgi:imidazolonepropionase-like amidohydrolase